MNRDDGNIVVTRESIKRISKDVRHIVKNPLHENGIYYEHDMENILRGYAMILGPIDTPYQDGFYFFEFTFPNDYPHRPPILKFLSNGDNIRFNPNLYRNGKVCISVLNTWRGEQWTSCQTISSILLTLCTILNERPLLNEPGVTDYDPQIEMYNTIISYKNVEVCILRMFENIKNDIAPYSLFKEICWSHFIKNRVRIAKSIDTTTDRAKESISSNGRGAVVSKIYGMTVKINKVCGRAMKKKVMNLDLEHVKVELV